MKKERVWRKLEVKRWTMLTGIDDLLRWYRGLASSNSSSLGALVVRRLGGIREERVGLK